MATFTPPSVTENPPILPGPEMTELAARLYRFYRARPAGVNVYMYKVGSLTEAALIANGGTRVTEDDPKSLYNSSGVCITNGWDDLEVVFWGGHAAVEVTSTQAAALVAAGYTVV